MEERYRFDEASYDAITAAGLHWIDVQDVLHGKPRVLQHVGAVMRVMRRTDEIGGCSWP